MTKIDWKTWVMIIIACLQCFIMGLKAGGAISVSWWWIMLPTIIVGIYLLYVFFKLTVFTTKVEEDKFKENHEKKE
ncbi:hypothetical protein ACWCL1_05250 [Ligilactobacillus sp. LYQ135]